MKSQLGKQTKGLESSKPATNTTGSTMLKENVSYLIPRTMGSANPKNEFNFKNSPQRLANKSIINRSRDPSVNKDESFTGNGGLKVHTKSISKIPLFQGNATSKNNSNLKNMLRGSSNRQIIGHFASQKETQTIFASPPAPQKEKIVLLNPPNSTGKQGLIASKNFTQKYSCNAPYYIDKNLTNNQQLDKETIIINNEYHVNARCLNHPTKEVKYFVFKQNLIKSKNDLHRAYCALCAVNLMQEGVKVLHIESKHARLTEVHNAHVESQEKVDEQNIDYSSDEEKESCQIKIEEFLQKLEGAKQECDQMGFSIENKLKSNDLSHTKQMKNLDIHFNKIFDLLLAKKEALKKQVNSSFSNNRKILEEKVRLFDIYKENFEDIQVDVEKHYERILQRLNYETLTTILTVYQEKIYGFDEFVKMTEDAVLSQSYLTFYEDFDNLKFSLDPKVQLIIKNWKIGKQTKNQNLSVSKKRAKNQEIAKQVSKTEIPIDDEPIFKTSRLLDSGLKSELVISFDKNNCKIMRNCNKKEENLLKTEEVEDSFEESSVQGYNRILSKIRQSQSVKQEFYDNFLDSNFANKVENRPFINQTEKAESQKNVIFELSNVDENMADKQTPELGQKFQYSKPITQHFNQLAYQKSRDTDRFQETQLLDSEITCQKMLFDDPSESEDGR